jgi:hypothetical protein
MSLITELWFWKKKKNYISTCIYNIKKIISISNYSCTPWVRFLETPLIARVVGMWICLCWRSIHSPSRTTAKFVSPLIPDVSRFVEVCLWSISYWFDILIIECLIVWLERVSLHVVVRKRVVDFWMSFMLMTGPCTRR